MLKLLVLETKDEVARENLSRIQKEVTIDQQLLRGQWKFIELTFDAEVANFKYPHKLSFVPKDVIQTSSIGTGTVIWNYDLFDRTNLDISTTEACTVRAFVGSYQEVGQ